MSIPALLSRIVFVNLQKKLSINAPCLSENLVGSVILGIHIMQVYVIITGKDYIVLYLV